jgi:ubiquinone/menaquinone biosynthesis C-methylase UbiE
MTETKNQQALEWQVGIWDSMSDVYSREIDRRFEPVTAGVVQRAELAPGERVLDLGTGTGAVAELASPLVGPTGSVLAVDISPAMLAIARRRFELRGLTNASVSEGRAEEIPAEDGSLDAVIASLSLMFAIDRVAAARELARVLRPGGRLAAAVWSSPDRSEFIRLQQIAGSFAPEPPVPGVSPGALGNPAPFLAQLADAGIDASAEEMDVVFEFASFDDAWTTFAGVTASKLTPELQEQAKAAIRAELYPDGDGPRLYRNVAIFITGAKRA